MSDSLLGLVNSSGFAFQLAVERAVIDSESRHGWEVTTREHGWQDNDDVRFADLVLTRDYIRLVVECKRTRGADWIFLVPQRDDAPRRRHFRAQCVRSEVTAQEGSVGVERLANFQLDPASAESSFCVVRGTGEDTRPMLDRVCAELTRAADTIAHQQLLVSGSRNIYGRLDTNEMWVTIPVIVTNARLHVCAFDPSAISLDDGLLPKSGATWQTAAHVRYRKAFDAPSPSAAHRTLKNLEAAMQRTVAVINAAALVDWLDEFNLERASYGG